MFSRLKELLQCKPFIGTRKKYLVLDNVREELYITAVTKNTCTNIFGMDNVGFSNTILDIELIKDNRVIKRTRKSYTDMLDDIIVFCQDNNLWFVEEI